MEGRGPRRPEASVPQAVLQGRQPDQSPSTAGVRSPLDLDARRLWPLQGAADELLFLGPRGHARIPTGSGGSVLKPTAEEAGVPWAGFHTFRHTCASLLFASGRNALYSSGSGTPPRVYAGHLRASAR